MERTDIFCKTKKNKKHFRVLTMVSQKEVFQEIEKYGEKYVSVPFLAERLKDEQSFLSRKVKKMTEYGILERVEVYLTKYCKTRYCYRVKKVVKKRWSK